MPVDKLEIEISKFVRDEGYSFSSEEDGKKRIYTIYSPELKKKLQKMIFPFGTSASVNFQYRGKNSFGDRIFYQVGKDDLPDQLTLISREVMQEMSEDEKIFFESENLIAELEQDKEKWKKREVELGITPNSVGTRHYFSGRKDGEIVYEGTYFKSETQSHLITLENKKNTPPQIQQITDEKAEKKDKETSKSLVKHEEKKDDKEAVFTPHHQISPKK